MAATTTTSVSPMPAISQSLERGGERGTEREREREEGRGEQRGREMMNTKNQEGTTALCSH